LDTVNQELDHLSHQEKDFAELQKKQELLKKQIRELEASLAKDQERDRELAKRLGAWEYYKRARDIKHQLDLSSQVKMFPSNGKEQWNQLMNRMKVIHDQKASLQEKLDEYTPKKKEDIIPWAREAEALEKLYVDLGQWRQTIVDVEALEEEKENWKLDFVNLGYSLPLWDRALPLEDACVHVDWAEGRRLAQSVGVRGNELHFWEQREPEVEAVAEEAADGDIQTEEDFQQMEDMASSLEQLLHQEAEIRGKIDAASQLEDKKFTFWFWLGILCMAGAAAGIASFYMAMAGTAALYGAAGGLMLGILCFLFNNKSIHKKGNDLEKWNDSLASLVNERKAISDKFPGQAPEDIDDLQAFHNLMQSRRSDFYKDQAKRQAISWKRET
ncbi:MAG: hypothetical protein U0I99_02970, partial [Dialister sp.]|nr:hypothetical protein [Dialister sp.]